MPSTTSSDRAQAKALYMELAAAKARYAAQPRTHTTEAQQQRARTNGQVLAAHAALTAHQQYVSSLVAERTSRGIALGDMRNELTRLFGQARSLRTALHVALLPLITA